MERTNLDHLHVRRILEAERDDVNTVRVANEQVVHHVVGLVAGELPHAQLTDTYTAVTSYV